MKKWLKTTLSLLLAIVMIVGNIAVARAEGEYITIEPSDDSWDIPLSTLEVSCGDYEPNGGANEGPANLAVDGNNATMWHTDWEGTSRENHWFQFELTEAYAVNGLRYLPRQTGNSNGTITKYEIRVSDDGVNFTTVASGDWAANSTWKIAQFAPQSVKYVRLYSIDAVTDNAWVFASAAEIRLTWQPTEPSDADKSALDALIELCETYEQGNYTARTWQKFQKALDSARTVSANIYASQEQVDAAREALAQALVGLKEKVEGEGIMKVLHLDSGRKYFTKDWHIALINELAAAGYTHLQLAFGNNGFRFLLDDMTIEANGTTYASDDIKEGVRQGNYNYGALTSYYSDDHALTEAEMDEIIAHAKSVGIEIIPHLNMPGHMSALLDAMDYIGIEGSHFTGRTESDSSVNLNNEKALNFMFALTEKYAAYFAERGVKYFHIGADEYANDAYYSAMGFPSIGATLYQKFADFVNANAAIIKSHGMTPIAWNDGIYYGSYTSEFDPDIVVDYWSSGWGGYTLAKSSTLNDKGHGLINTNGDYYYIVGKDDRFTPGTSTAHDPSMYTECAGYDLNRFMDGSNIEEPMGGMFCIWADYPGRETEQQIGAAIRLVLRAMAMRMEGLDIDGLDTNVVPGGFNEDGTIAESGGHVHEFCEWVTTATCTEPGIATRTCACGETETREDAALGHDYVVHEVVPPTCTKSGYTVYKCTRCDKTYKDDPVEPEHKFDEGTVTAPTCTAQGYTTYTCTVCGEKYVDEASWVPATGHTAGEAVKENEVAATCTAAGSYESVTYCVDCGVELSRETVTVDPLGHDYVVYEVVPPTCTKSGYTVYKCTRCDKTYKDDPVEPEHKFDEGTVTAPTCVDLGYTTYTCTLCGLEYVDEASWVSALGHDYINGDCTRCDSVQESAFIDVPVGAFFFDPVAWAVDNGITKGISATEFGPMEECNRAQVVTFLWRAAGSPSPNSSANPFRDVKPSDFYYEAVLWAVEQGITKGISETEFAPAEKCNRAQVVTFLWRAMGQPEVTAAENPFSDVVATEWYAPAVLWAVEKGITNGIGDGTFGILTNCNRAQVVTFLYRTLA